MIINKPCGIAVHGGSGNNYGIIEILRKIRKDIPYLELIHRIDKETSGLLMLAKKISILKNMHQQLRDRIIKKEYLGIAHGHWKKTKNQVILPLLKKKNINNKAKVFIDIKGKFSQTNFKIKKYYSKSTLLSIYPITGRTHQIRIHTAELGHPILFDKRYGHSNLHNQHKINKKKSRLFLHAYKINFIHPKLNKRIFFLAPLDSKFKKYLKFLENN